MILLYYTEGVFFYLGLASLLTMGKVMWKFRKTTPHDWTDNNVDISIGDFHFTGAQERLCLPRSPQNLCSGFFCNNSGKNLPMDDTVATGGQSITSITFPAPIVISHPKFPYITLKHFAPFSSVVNNTVNKFFRLSLLWLHGFQEEVHFPLDHLTPYLNQILKGYSPRQTTLTEEAQHKYCSSSTTISKKVESGLSSNSKRPSQNFLTKEFLGLTVCMCDILMMEVNMELEKMKEKQEVNVDKGVDTSKCWKYNSTLHCETMVIRSEMMPYVYMYTDCLITREMEGD
ncbi:hypothetical protein L1887_03045 [Cichorium endivia]|nr:hypothetical protein L1887_03045 [Cichorium endivia]